MTGDLGFQLQKRLELRTLILYRHAEQSNVCRGEREAVAATMSGSVGSANSLLLSGWRVSTAEITSR